MHAGHRGRVDWWKYWEMPPISWYPAARNKQASTLRCGVMAGPGIVRLRGTAQPGRIAGGRPALGCPEPAGADEDLGPT